MSLNGCLGNSEIGGCKEIHQPFADPSPTFRQPFANLLCQPLSNPLFPWTPSTRLETRVNGFLGIGVWKCPRVPYLNPMLSITGLESGTLVGRAPFLPAPAPLESLNLFLACFALQIRNFKITSAREKGTFKCPV